MQSNSYVIFESLSIRRLIAFICSNKDGLTLLKTSKLFFIDQSLFIQILERFNLINEANFSFKKLCFKLIELKDSNGESLRIRIYREDLYQLMEYIKKDKEYSKLFDCYKSENSLYEFQLKGLIDGHAYKPNTLSRLLVLINLIDLKLPGNYKKVLIAKNRGWINAVKRYAKEKKIEVKYEAISFDFNGFLNNLIYKIKISNSVLYFILRSFKYIGINDRFNKNHNKKDISNQLFLEGRGDVRVENDGHHNDFFWVWNSSFKSNGLTYICKSKKEKDLIQKKEINVARVSLSLRSLFLKGIGIRFKDRISQINSKEKRLLNLWIKEYNSNKSFWYNLFLSNNVKIIINWHLFDRFNYSQNDAIKEIGGISVYLPVSFQGYKSIDCLSKFDISFCYSKFSANLETKSLSQMQYQIIVGYPRDYSISLLNSEAKLIREKIKSNGAKRIICVLDENSQDDERWHTGHVLQRENYKLILEEVIRNSKLGVIFKPKTSKTLYQRLGYDIVKLIEQAESTGRCFIFLENSRYTTIASPALAALASDLTIGCHLCSGTAAFESVLTGVPTILIDREGTPCSLLANKLKLEKVIFSNWENALNASLDYLNDPKQFKEFGDWSDCIQELDPFRDGLSAKRIGDFLQSLRDGFAMGLEKEEVIIRACDIYTKRWGKEMVIKNY
tara:strand:- start:5970 stop:7988 length:2019 start_codon:yes stop_codon:yes gene_type:complete